MSFSWDNSSFLSIEGVVAGVKRLVDSFWHIVSDVEGSVVDLRFVAGSSRV